MEKKEIRFKINGENIVISIKPNKTLLEMIREDLKLTGTKEACDHGECGACTVLMNGVPVNSCLVLAMEAHGKEILTIEGLKQNNRLDPIQEAFIQNTGMQCGFCTPGMIMSTKALLNRNSKPSDDEIKEAIAGNLCRCTGYTKIFESIKDASSKIGGK